MVVSRMQKIIKIDLSIEKSNFSLKNIYSVFNMARSNGVPKSVLIATRVTPNVNKIIFSEVNPWKEVRDSL